MEEIWDKIWGSGTSLNCLQMSCRGIAVFFIALILIRLSGRRSFGIGTPLDNIIVILLGALLSRAVVGASPFVPIVCVCLAVVLLHRVFCWLKIHNPRFSHLVEGDKVTIYSDGHFVKDNMDRALLCEEDILQGVRESALTEDMEKIRKIYLERNGTVSVVEKEKAG